nr:hypothetical protein GCM10017745_11320 [Saccharothrix mutabilis subsp. capreolus]
MAAGLPGGRELGGLVGWEREAVLAVATSGSTGSPKVVLLSAGALVASAEATHARLGGAGTWLLALPTTHIAGVQVLVRSIVAGTEPVVMDLAAGFRASGFATAARALLATPGPHYTALVPTQLARLVATEGPGWPRSARSTPSSSAAPPRRPRCSTAPARPASTSSPPTA